MKGWSINHGIVKEQGTNHNRRDQRLKQACKAFEAIFTHEVLKSMRRTVEKCDLFDGGQGEEIYESLLDQEISKGMAGNGPGSLAQHLYRQLKRSEGTEKAETKKALGAHDMDSTSKALRKKYLETPDSVHNRPVLEIRKKSR